MACAPGAWDAFSPSRVKIQHPLKPGRAQMHLADTGLVWQESSHDLQGMEDERRSGGRSHLLEWRTCDCEGDILEFESAQALNRKTLSGLINASCCDTGNFEGFPGLYVLPVLSSGFSGEGFASPGIFKSDVA